MRNVVTASHCTRTRSRLEVRLCATTSAPSSFLLIFSVLGLNRLFR